MVSVQVGRAGKPPEDEASGSNPLGRTSSGSQHALLYLTGAFRARSRLGRARHLNS
jgi:hypothetical protein